MLLELGVVQDPVRNSVSLARIAVPPHLVQRKSHWYVVGDMRRRVAVSVRDVIQLPALGHRDNKPTV